MIYLDKKERHALSFAFISVSHIHKIDSIQMAVWHLIGKHMDLVSELDNSRVSKDPFKEIGRF